MRQLGFVWIENSHHQLENYVFDLFCLNLGFHVTVVGARRAAGTMWNVNVTLCGVHRVHCKLLRDVFSTAWEGYTDLFQQHSDDKQSNSWFSTVVWLPFLQLSHIGRGRYNHMSLGLEKKQTKTKFFSSKRTTHNVIKNASLWIKDNEWCNASYCNLNSSAIDSYPHPSIQWLAIRSL